MLYYIGNADRHFSIFETFYIPCIIYSHIPLLRMGIHLDKCIVRQFHHCMNIIKWTINLMRSVLIRQRKKVFWDRREEDSDTEEKVMWRWGRYWRDVATSQGSWEFSTATRRWKRQEGSSFASPERVQSCLHLGFRILASQLWQNISFVNHQVCGNFLWEPQKTNKIIFWFLIIKSITQYSLSFITFFFWFYSLLNFYLYFIFSFKKFKRSS